MFKTIKLRVGNASYTVEKVDGHTLEGMLGSASTTKKLIQINTQDKMNKHNGELFETLVHEVFHAVFLERDLESTLEVRRELHEKIVTQMAAGFVGVMIDNPVFLQDMAALAHKSRKDLDI